MKIAFVITGLQAGGAERMMCRLVKGMSPRFEPLVISLTEGGVLREDLERAGIPVRTAGMTGIASFPLAVHRLVRMYRSFGPDVVSTWMYHADLVGLDVVSSSGRSLGKVVAMESFGAHPLMRVEGGEGGGDPAGRLVPFVEPILRSVDLKARRIEVDWEPEY